jgi:hypothetical protein
MTRPGINEVCTTSGLMHKEQGPALIYSKNPTIKI